MPAPSSQSPAARHRGRAAGCPRRRTARWLEHHLEAVIIGRIVAAGDHDAAVDRRARPRHNRASASARARSGPRRRRSRVRPRTSAASSTGELSRPSRPTATRLPPAAPNQGPEAAADRIGVVRPERLPDDPADVIFAQDRRVETDGSTRASSVGVSGAFRRARRPAVQFGDQRVAGELTRRRELGRAAGIGMDPRDQPAMGGADLGDRSADAEQARASSTGIAAGGRRRQAAQSRAPPSARAAAQRCSSAAEAEQEDSARRLVEVKP